MKIIKDCLINKNTCVMALIMISENNGEIPKTLYIVLSFVFYSLIYNYFCVDFLSYQSKILGSISSSPTFDDTSFNILLGIGITELLLNLVSCHGFMKKQNSTVILNCQNGLINNYSSKVFHII